MPFIERKNIDTGGIQPLVTLDDEAANMQIDLFAKFLKNMVKQGHVVVFSMKNKLRPADEREYSFTDLQKMAAVEQVSDGYNIDISRRKG